MTYFEADPQAQGKNSAEHTRFGSLPLLLLAKAATASGPAAARYPTARRQLAANDVIPWLGESSAQRRK